MIACSDRRPMLPVVHWMTRSGRSNSGSSWPATLERVLASVQVAVRQRSRRAPAAPGGPCPGWPPPCCGRCRRATAMAMTTPWLRSGGDRVATRSANPSVPVRHKGDVQHPVCASMRFQHGHAAREIGDRDRTGIPPRLPSVRISASSSREAAESRDQVVLAALARDDVDVIGRERRSVGGGRQCRRSGRSRPGGGRAPSKIGSGSRSGPLRRSSRPRLGPASR